MCWSGAPGEGLGGLVAVEQMRDGIAQGRRRKQTGCISLNLFRGTCPLSCRLLRKQTQVFTSLFPALLWTLGTKGQLTVW